MRTEDIRKMGQAYLQVLEKSQKEAMDPVNKKALKKDFDDREDKDIDNDGDEDESDEYLHKKRKAISKAIKKNGDKADNDTEVQTQEAKDLDDKNVEKLVKHDCATHVEHAEFGAGVCIPGEHTLVESSDGEGYVTHYDVMFDHGIEKDVMVEDLKITKSEAHIHAGKKMKKESVELDEAATAQTKPDEKTRDTYEKQLSTRKGEKDFVDQHKSEVPVAADEPKIDAMNFKTFKAMTKKSPARSADQTKGDTKIIPSATPVKEDADQLDEISVGLAKKVYKARADRAAQASDEFRRASARKQKHDTALHSEPDYEKGRKHFTNWEKARKDTDKARVNYQKSAGKLARSGYMLGKKTGAGSGGSKGDRRYDATPAGKWDAYREKGGKLSRAAYDKRFGNR